MTYNEGPTKTFTAGSAMGQYLRVKTSSSLALAGATDVELGTLEESVFDVGAPTAVRLCTAAGTAKMVASGAIMADGTVYAAAGGKVSTTGSLVIGQALSAATADGDIIEVLRHADVGPVLTNQTVTADDSSTVLNQIAAGVNVVTVDGVTNDADDYVELPAIADVSLGTEITVIGAAGSNFEVRTPTASGTTINNVDSDGNQEYLFTDTQTHVFRKVSATGWLAVGYTNLGAVATAVVPD